MNVGVVGSRNYPDHLAVWIFMHDLPVKWDGLTTRIISGGAPGPDTWAYEIALERNMEWTIYHADWEHHGRKAGYLRNQIIVYNSDWIVAFWDGKSKGTKHTIDFARKQRKPVYVQGLI